MSHFLNQDFGSESEDDDFNPAPEVGSDAEDEAAGQSRENENEESEAPSKREGNDGEGIRRREPSVRDDEAEEDAEGEEEGEPGDEDEEGEGEDLNGEDEEEDDDEEEEEDRPRKRHKRDRRNQFIDVEAEVDDEDEEEDFDEDELPDETHPDDLIEMPPGAETDDRRHRELDRQRELAASMDAEKQAKILQERYGRRERVGAEVSAIPQHLLLPSVDDPTIWAVKCKPGKENEVAAAIWRRFVQHANTREALRITAAFGRTGTSMIGYVYVEARRQADVLHATDSITNCYPRTAMKIIPINEMPDLLRTQKPKMLEPGMYVRIRRPLKYASDLALVQEVDPNGMDATVKLIPRIDYGHEDDLNGPGGIKRKKPGAVRPPQRLFSEAEARKKMSKALTQISTLGGKSFQFQGEQFVDGFLMKDIKVNALQIDNVNPTLEEVTKFAAGGEDGTSENLDLAQLAATLKSGAAAAEFVAGDMVEVYQGEQSGVKGKAVSVTSDIVTIQVSQGPLRGQKLEAPAKTLRKLFREGDHVRVTGGSKYHDEVGLVVRVKDDRVTFITDSEKKEITVFSRDLREASDTSGFKSVGLSRYELHDLVQLDAATVAAVTKVERESLRVLDQYGSVKDILPSSISNKLDRRRHIVATDREGNEIRNDDAVKEFGGEQRQGRILHVYRNYIFVLSTAQIENAGVFVIPRSSVVLVGSKSRNQAPDPSKMNPALLRNGANGASPSMGPPRTIGRDRLIGKTVTLKRGMYKGLLGIVKDTTDTDARVELHTKGKIITVPKDHLNIKDPHTGENMSFGPGGRLQSGFNRNMPMRTGGSRIPEAAGGSRTPIGAGGGRTPWGAGASGDGSKTPAWERSNRDSQSGGSRTPAYASYGGRTAYGGDGSRTSYGGDGSRTAYGGASSYGGGSRTPYGAGSSALSALSAPTPGASRVPSGSAPTPGGPALDAPTPGPYGAPTPSARTWDAPTPGGPPTGRYDSAPTPRAWDAATPGDNLGAPTPGAALSAPTPRAWDAPTPGGPRAWDAPTPGGPLGAPTPGATYGYAAETPGAVDDDGPRYE